MIKPQKFRKKPVVIEALQFQSPVAVADILHFCDGKAYFSAHLGLRIRTLEGEVLASPGDWIIKGVKGEFYPCKPDIFEKTYEQADEHRCPFCGSGDGTGASKLGEDALVCDQCGKLALVSEWEAVA